MKKKRRAVLAAALALVLTLTGVTALASSAGSSGDPLVSLSYLNDTFLSAIMTKVESLISTRNTTLKKELSAEIAAEESRLAAKYGTSSSGTAGSGDYSAATFTVVTLSKGQTLKGLTGCEMMLRVGSAACVAASAPGLVDSTSGSTISSGAALTANHLYMATVDGRGLKATAATTKVLVRGEYSVS